MVNFKLTYLFVIVLFAGLFSSCTKEGFCPKEDDSNLQHMETRGVVTNPSEAAPDVPFVEPAAAVLRNDLPDLGGGGITDDDDNESSDDERTTRRRVRR